MAGIQITSLSKTYRAGARALDGVNLEVAGGELLTLVGPSGSGKTTLLRLVAGLEQPTAGAIRIGGQNMAAVPPYRRNVSLVFQNLALYSHLTVRGNLKFGLQASAEPGVRIADSVDQAAELLGIADLLDRYPAELSGGEQQRVALGRAMVRRPAALLLDEPLTGVDGPLRRSLRRLVKDVQRRLGVPAIYVTHDSAEALALGDRVAVLRQGRLEQVGTPADIYDRPASRFVAEFFGPQGMNFLVDEEPVNGEQMLTAFRPEDAELASDGPVSGELESVESFGATRYARLRLKTNAAVTVQLDHRSTPPHPGDTVHFRVPPERLCRFDASTGLRWAQPTLPTES